MARGGARAGAPGTSYANRTDLNTAKALPPQAAKGQSYGMAGAQLAAQKVTPVAPPPTASPATVGGPGVGSPPAPAPGTLPPLAGPTARPGEPVTSGLPIGAGPGPSPTQPQYQSVNDLLAGLAASPNASPEIQRLHAYVQGGGM